jgi:UDP-MurNAc hydroxylase
MINESSITLKMVYSACVVIKTPDVVVLCDPWFTDGIYDGSWFVFPSHEDPKSVIGDCDFVYISHIHPDHYDPAFLRSYFAEYGGKPFIIADRSPNYLAMKLGQDFENAEVFTGQVTRGETEMKVYSHNTGSNSDIDSALEVAYRSSNKVHRVINLNDCVYDPDFLCEIKAEKNFDVCLTGYAGAGSYPQTYFSLDDPELKKAAELKKAKMFERYLNTTESIDASINIPFAGQYVLGGKFTKLNQHRGVADATEVLNLDRRSVVLEDYGGTISTDDLSIRNGRLRAYSDSQLEVRLNEIIDRKMIYETDNAEPTEFKSIQNALSISEINARQKSECTRDYFFVFVFEDETNLAINANRNSTGGVTEVVNAWDVGEPRSEIYIDRRYFYGLLTRQFHWNNAEVGSQYETRRFPNEFDRAAQRYLNFLAV